MNYLRAVGVLLTLLALQSPAAAALPDDVLDKDYQACRGDGQDQERNSYCACVREGMRNWDEQTYVQVVMQSAMAKTANQAPDKLLLLAKACMTDSLPKR